MRISKTAQGELEQIRLTSEDGKLHPRAVVAFAEDESTALHKCFEWDDSEAARKFRLAQAAAIIRVAVRIETNGEESMRVRAYCSLPSDRAADGGYRAVVDVVSDEMMRQELLQTALDELSAFRRKYAALTQLEPLFSALEKIDEALAVPA